MTGTAATSAPPVPATPANAFVLAQVTVPGAAANLNAATITQQGTPAMPVIPLGLLYLGTDQNCGALAQLQGMVQGDMRGGMSSSTGNDLVIPQSGIYVVSCSAIALSTAGSNAYVQTLVYKNGANTVITASAFSTVSGQYVGMGATRQARLVSGDKLTLMGVSPTAMSTWKANLPASTWLQAQLNSA